MGTSHCLVSHCLISALPSHPIPSLPIHMQRRQAAQTPTTPHHSSHPLPAQYPSTLPHPRATSAHPNPKVQQLNTPHFASPKTPSTSVQHNSIPPRAAIRDETRMKLARICSRHFRVPLLHLYLILLFLGELWFLGARVGDGVGGGVGVGEEGGFGAETHFLFFEEEEEEEGGDGG